MLKKMAAKAFVMMWKDMAIIYTMCVSWVAC